MTSITTQTRPNIDPEVFREVYEKRMELYVKPERKPLIQNLVANQVASIKIINSILETIKSVDGISSFCTKPDISCRPRYNMEGGGIIYRTKDGYPHSVLTNSGIIRFGGGSGSLKDWKVLHDRITSMFGLIKIKSVISGIMGVNYTIDWFNITRSEFGNDLLNLSLTSDNIDHITPFKTRQEFISDLESKVIEAGTLVQVSDLVHSFAFRFNKSV